MRAAPDGRGPGRAGSRSARSDWALMELSLAAPAGASGAGIVALSTHDVHLSLSTTTAPPTPLSVGAQRAAQLVASAEGGARGVGSLLNGSEWRFSGVLQRSHWLSRFFGTWCPDGAGEAHTAAR